MNAYSGHVFALFYGINNTLLIKCHDRYPGRLHRGFSGASNSGSRTEKGRRVFKSKTYSIYRSRDVHTWFEIEVALRNTRKFLLQLSAERPVAATAKRRQAKRR